MSKPTFGVPDSRTWTFLGIGDQPVKGLQAPAISAHLPIEEVTKILMMVSYLNAQLAACDAVATDAP